MHLSTIAIAVVLLAATAAYAQHRLPAICGKPPIQPDLSTRIVGGKEAVSGSWPWQIALRYNNRHRCGGSIIDENYVVTAAHCTYGLPAASFTIHAGRHLRNESITEPFEQVGIPQTMWQHERYNDDTVNNDITLFRVKTPFTFNDYVHPVCLPSAPIDASGTPLYATGWGQVQGTCCEGRLKQVTLPALSRAQCRAALGLLFRESMICAGQEVGDTTCMGDSGGPLVALVNGTYELHGLTSFGRDEICSIGGPPVFANVFHFHGWITSKIFNVEAEMAEVAARGVRPIPVGHAFRKQQLKLEQEALDEDFVVEDEGFFP